MLLGLLNNAALKFLFFLPAAAFQSSSGNLIPAVHLRSFLLHVTECLLMCRSGTLKVGALLRRGWMDG